jgi:hypothetical protein
VDRRRELDPGVAATADDEGQPGAALVRVRRAVGSFEGVDDVVAELEGVGRGVEEPGVFAQAGQVGERRDAAERDDEGVVGAGAGGGDDLAAVEVDPLDLGLEEVEAPSTLKGTNRDDDVGRIRPPIGDGPEEGREQQAAVAVDDEHAGRLWREPAIQGHGGRYAAEAAAEDHDAVFGPLPLIGALAAVHGGSVLIATPSQQLPQAEGSADHRHHPAERLAHIRLLASLESLPGRG